MKILRSYIKSGLYNITHNKMYTLFYCIGTAFTFVFVILLLQIAHLVAGTDVPFVNAQRTVHLEAYFEDSHGEYINGISMQAAHISFKDIDEISLYSFSNTESTNASVNNKIRPANVNFVDGNYFIINQFDFLIGRAFTEEEVQNHKQLAIITKSFADRYFQGDIKDKYIEIQGNNYMVVGVVNNFSSLLNPYETANIWVPYTFNKFIPSAEVNYSIDVMFKEDVPLETIKDRISRILNNFFEQSQVDFKLTKDSILTIQEEKSIRLGGSMFVYGVALIVFLLLFIPALNIMTLSMSNVQNRAKEVALRRSVGARRIESFLQILVENFMLVMAGLALALILLHPVTGLIEYIFLNSTESVTVLTNSGLKLETIIFAILLGIVFSVLSGGIPAWIISKKNIAKTLKGGEND